jgi:hypothetical protein
MPEDADILEVGSCSGAASYCARDAGSPKTCHAFATTNGNIFSGWIGIKPATCEKKTEHTLERFSRSFNVRFIRMSQDSQLLHTILEVL